MLIVSAPDVDPGSVFIPPIQVFDRAAALTRELCRRPRAADAAVAVEHNRWDGVRGQIVRSGQAGQTCADDNHGFNSRSGVRRW